MDDAPESVFRFTLGARLFPDSGADRTCAQSQTDWTNGRVSMIEQIARSFRDDVPRSFFFFSVSLSLPCPVPHCPRELESHGLAQRERERALLGSLTDPRQERTRRRPTKGPRRVRLFSALFLSSLLPRGSAHSGNSLELDLKVGFGTTQRRPDCEALTSDHRPASKLTFPLSLLAQPRSLLDALGMTYKPDYIQRPPVVARVPVQAHQDEQMQASASGGPLTMAAVTRPGSTAPPTSGQAQHPGER